MKKIFLSFSLLFFCASFFHTSSVNAQTVATGRSIMEQQYAQNKGWRGESGVGKIIISDNAGGAAEREFEYKQLEGSSAQGNKSFLRIIKPASLNGTGLLTHQNPGRDDDQWVYLPALKKTNRIVGGARKGRFIGSDFSYEDLAPKGLDDYSYTLIRDEACGSVMCHVIEGTRLNNELSYAKITLWVQNDNLQNAKMELFDDDGKLVKRVLFSDYKQINAIYWRPFKLVMENLEKKSSSTFQVVSLNVGNNLTEADFSKNILER